MNNFINEPSYSDEELIEWRKTWLHKYDKNAERYPLSRSQNPLLSIPPKQSNISQPPNNEKFNNAFDNFKAVAPLLLAPLVPPKERRFVPPPMRPGEFDYAERVARERLAWHENRGDFVPRRDNIRLNNHNNERIMRINNGIIEYNNASKQRSQNALDNYRNYGSIAYAKTSNAIRNHAFNLINGIEKLLSFRINDPNYDLNFEWKIFKERNGIPDHWGSIVDVKNKLQNDLEIVPKLFSDIANQKRFELLNPKFEFAPRTNEINLPNTPYNSIIHLTENHVQQYYKLNQERLKSFAEHNDKQVVLNNFIFHETSTAPAQNSIFTNPIETEIIPWQNQNIQQIPTNNEAANSELIKPQTALDTIPSSLENKDVSPEGVFVNEPERDNERNKNNFEQPVLNSTENSTLSWLKNFLNSKKASISVAQAEQNVTEHQRQELFNQMTAQNLGQAIDDNTRIHLVDSSEIPTQTNSGKEYNEVPFNEFGKYIMPNNELVETKAFASKDIANKDIGQQQGSNSDVKLVSNVPGTSLQDFIKTIMHASRARKSTSVPTFGLTLPPFPGTDAIQSIYSNLIF